MTTQERATMLVDEHGSEPVSAEAIAAAIEAAVAAERERCAVIAEIAATHALGDPCRIIAKRIRIDPATGECPRTEMGVTPP